ncbi:hypothetical protein [Microcoleus sp. herbarium12]|uniref:hypothetical protein n=1 Tax=Microcoleus sp. herbarium12 TaxID=3055437 RepID=UPI002FD00F67
MPYALFPVVRESESSKGYNICNAENQGSIIRFVNRSSVSTSQPVKVEKEVHNSLNWLKIVGDSWLKASARIVFWIRMGYIRIYACGQVASRLPWVKQEADPSRAILIE